MCMDMNIRRQRVLSFRMRFQSLELLEVLHGKGSVVELFPLREFLIRDLTTWQFAPGCLVSIPEQSSVHCRRVQIHLLELRSDKDADCRTIIKVLLL